MKYSIIVPVRNGEKTINTCIDSILKQKEDFELIIVDNNSTDSTKKIISDKKDKRIKYVFEEKVGRGSARNTGISNAKGKIILMTDADCIVPENWIKEMTKNMPKEKAVMGGEFPIQENYWTKNVQKANSDFLKNLVKKDYISSLDTKNFAIESKLAKKINFDKNMGALEDFEFYLRLKKYTKIRFLPKIKVGHNHPGSLISIIKTNFERGFWAEKIFQKHKDNQEPFLECRSIKNTLRFIKELPIEFIRKPLKEFLFKKIYDSAYRIGLIYCIFKEKLTILN